MEQEYLKILEGSNQGFDYEILKLKHPVGEHGIPSADGMFTHEISITKDNQKRASVFVGKPGEALKEIAEHVIKGLILDERI